MTTCPCIMARHLLCRASTNGLASMYWGIEVVCRNDGVTLAVDDHDTTLVHDSLGEAQLLCERLDEPA